MKILVTVMASAALFLCAAAVLNAKYDKIHALRKDFGPGIDGGQSPVAGHFEELHNISATPKDWVRVRREILSDPQFKGWAVSGDITGFPTPENWSCSLSLSSPDGKEHLSLIYRPQDSEFHLPGLELDYDRPFRFFE